MVIEQDKAIGQQMLTEAIKLLPTDDFGGVAILRLNNGSILNSIWAEPAFETTPQCAEIGTIYEAIKLRSKVTHALCIFSKDNELGYEILSPCSICQDRLRRWGDGVKCAISTKNNTVVFKTIGDLDPYFWGEKYVARCPSVDLDIGQAMLRCVAKKFHKVFGPTPDKNVGAAVIRLADGRLLVSVKREAVFESLVHGIAEGALIQAEEYKQPVTHIICIRRRALANDWEIVSPDGDCKEKLYRWGNRIQCAVSTANNTVHFVLLRSLTPYHWMSRH